MGANDLGPSKVRQIAKITGLPVVRALVWSHVQSGRFAVFVTKDGQTGEFDRRTGGWWLK